MTRRAPMNQTHALNLARWYERQQNKLAVGVEFSLLANKDSSPEFMRQVKRLDAALGLLPFKVQNNIAKRLGRSVLKQAAKVYRQLWLLQRPKKPTNKVRSDISNSVTHSADVKAGLVVATTGVRARKYRYSRLAGPLNKRSWQVRDKMAAAFPRARFEELMAREIENTFVELVRKEGLKVVQR